MQRKTVRFATAFVTVLVAVKALPQEPHKSLDLKERSSKLQECLRDYIDGPETPFTVAWTDLNGDRIEEALVRLRGSWCGSGGCTMLVVKQAGSCFEVVSKIKLTRLPIRVLESKSNGWRSLGVWVEGGGIESGYEAELRFDGHSYPSNPTTVSNRRTSAMEVKGEVLMPAPNKGLKH